MRMFSRALTFLGLLLMTGSLLGAEKFGSLTVEEVAQKLKQKNVYVYDNNPKPGYDKGHVPGAKWLDYKHVTAADLPADKTATLIFYCQNEH